MNRVGNLVAALVMMVALCFPSYGVTITPGDLVGGVFTYSDSFTGFLGSADPTNWITADVASTSTWQGTGAGASTTGGKYSYGTGSGSTFDGSLGFLPSSSRAITASIAFTNSTGGPLENFTVSYVGEQWREVAGGNDNNWTASYVVDGGTAVNLPSLTFSPQRTTNQSGSLVFSQNLSAALTGLNLADASTITISLLGSNGAAGGSRQGIAVDDFQLTAAAVPEPSTMAIGSVGLALAAAAARRRQRVRPSQAGDDAATGQN